MMGSSVGRTPVIMTVGIFAMGWVTPVLAADPQSGVAVLGEERAEGGIEDIVVTAQKRVESLTKVGISIAVVSGDELQRRSITDAQDLVRIVPGFTFSNSGLNTPVYSIRGVGFNDSTLAASPTVSVYVDQVALPYPAMTQGATLDLERLEVLKGPQGTLFGQNATAGAINYIARKPTERLEAGLSASFSSFTTADVQAYLSGPLGDAVRARLAVSRTIGGDWQKSVTRPGDTLGEVDRGAARFLLDWDAAANLSFAFSLNGWFDKSDGPAGQLVQTRFGNANPLFQLPEVRNAPVASHDNRQADWNPTNRPHRDDGFYQASLRADWKLAEAATLTSITSYNRYTADTTADPDGIASANAEFRLQGRVRSFAQELRLDGTLGGFHGLIGGSYQSDRVQDDQVQNFPSSSGAQSVAGVKVFGQKVTTRQSVESWGVFANGDYKLAERLTAVGGVRYTREKRDFSGCALDNGDGLFALAFTRLQAALSRGLPPLTPFLPGKCFTLGAAPTFSATRIVADLDEDNISWNAGLNFEPGDRSLIYLRVARGYKSGNFPTISYTSVDQSQPVTQESVLAYEGGFRTTLLNRHLRLEGAGFYYDYTNKQLKGKKLILPFGPLNSLQNVPKSHVWGAEFSAMAELVDGFKVNASATYIRTKVTRFVGYDPNGVLRDLAGIEFNFSPHWQVQGGANYEVALSGSLRGSVGVDAIYRSKATSALGGDSAFDLPAYALIDVQAGISNPDAGWRLSVWGKNVTNRFYALNVVRYVDTIARVAGRPATFGVTFGMNFR